MKDELTKNSELLDAETDEEMDNPYADEWLYEMTDYLGQPVSVPESLVDTFLKQQEELKAKYGDKMSPEMEEAMARSRELSKGIADGLYEELVAAGLIKPELLKDEQK